MPKKTKQVLTFRDKIPLYNPLHYKRWKEEFIATCKLRPNCAAVLSKHFTDPCTTFKDYYPDDYAYIDAGTAPLYVRKDGEHVATDGKNIIAKPGETLVQFQKVVCSNGCLLYTSPSPRD